ncbi:recombinase family protein [Arthrobacter sp. B2a2-09]|uniref:recombinase family protein n=1 Tax=Arthrobacter sp. B2a2-09 TaxID=2952822 RepID=UPI0022CD9BB5|nr:recombinase family protein [Arthrobacter sp. B2a2-09]MCZ9883708.1 recombinase family protein [Arthrobacter sp. B2a2-09]
MTTSAVYLRISKDKGLGTESEGHAVDRQRKDIHKMLKARNWEIGTEYLDNDVSASGKVPRPAYQQMLADFEAGKIDAIAAWKLDRLWRRPKELEHIIELVEKSSLTVATTDSDIDLATPTGRTMARILTTFAQDELDKRSARQKARFAQDREAGHHHWRGRRPFGLTLEGKLVKEEAVAIQEIADSIINDGTISAGVTLLNERGLKTTFGDQWQRQPLRRTLMHPRLAGLRKHNVEVIKGKDGEPDKETYELIKGNWEAVLEEDQWRSLVARLETKGRPKPKQTDYEYLLSGLLTCEVCKDKAYGRKTRRKQKDGSYKESPIYRCTNGHVSKMLYPTDDYVILRTLERILEIKPEAVEVDKQALSTLRQKRATELKFWADWLEEDATADPEDRMKPSEIRPYRQSHEARLRDIESKIAELEKVSLVRLPEIGEEGMNPEGELEMVFDWDKLSIEKRRRMVSLMWKTITLKAVGKGARWDNANIVMIPRELARS